MCRRLRHCSDIHVWFLWYVHASRLQKICLFFHAQLVDIVAAATSAVKQGSLNDCYLPRKCLLRRELVATFIIAREAGVFAAL